MAVVHARGTFALQKNVTASMTKIINSIRDKFSFADRHTGAVNFATANALTTSTESRFWDGSIYRPILLRFFTTTGRRNTCDFASFCSFVPIFWIVCVFLRAS